MNGPENNSFINEALPVNNVDEFENKQDKIAEVICLFLPQQMTETVTSSEEQTVLLQLNEEPLYIINGDIPKYPLAIEETTVVNSENLNVGSEVVTTDNGIIKEGTNIIHDNDLKTQSIAQQEEKHFVNNFCQTSTEKEKNYICNLCKKSFIRKCDLNRHYKTHSTQKNYDAPYVPSEVNDFPEEESDED
ncbi:uncharacterized protein LOC142334017 [Lycorma delicatula]|uniref:uncharacterized protein LOC142334017 n=1 Tax=Lycorma delicatula TaxID=130591 RepID=UPI003F50D848